MDVEDEAVGEDGEKGGEAFDSMYKRHWNLGGGSRREDMSANLEQREW